MPITRRKVLITAGIAAAAMVSAALAIRNSTRPSCRNPARWQAMEMQKASGCLEFWVNRYQTAWSALLGAAVALGAAVLAWLGIQRQLAASQESVRIALGEIEPSFVFRRDPVFLDTDRGMFEIRIANRSKHMLTLDTIKLIKPVEQYTVGIGDLDGQREVVNGCAKLAKVIPPYNEERGVAPEVRLAVSFARRFIDLPKVIEFEISYEFAVGRERKLKVSFTKPD